MRAVKIERLTDFDDEYVYDIIMDDETTPYFFANDILVHNSCYFKTFATNKDDAIATANLVADGVNQSFIEFMQNAFNCQPGFDDLIKAGREIVGSRGLFQAKKKYVIKVVDQEGFAVNKLKSQGSEIKKADTPKIIQEFLKTTVDMILDGKSYDEIATYVNEQRKLLLRKKENMFALGVAKQVNNLDKFYAEYVQFEKSGIRKAKLPGHVRASINYNELLNIYDTGAKAIQSGDKVLIYYVKPNQFKIESIALPADLLRFPKWFEDNFSVDVNKTEDKMFDNKLSGIFKALGKDVPTPQTVLINNLLEF